MSHGFFRGTSLDQDTRFSNRDKKLMEKMKFPENFSEKVDMKKVEFNVIRPWIAKKITELMEIEDEVLINLVIGLLEEKDVPDPKEIQVQVTAFMNRKAEPFMEELWTLLLSAQENGGIPFVILEEQKAAIQKKLEEQKRNQEEVIRRKELVEKGQRERAQNRNQEDATIRTVNEIINKQIEKADGTSENAGSGRNQINTERRRSRSPIRRRSRSPARKRSRSPRRRSRSPRRRSRSPRRRSRSPRRRSRSPRRRSRSPRRRRSRSPRTRTRSPGRRTRRSRSPRKRSRSPRRRSRSPQRRSKSPSRRIDRSPKRRKESPPHDKKEKSSASPPTSRSRSRSNSPESTNNHKQHSKSPVRKDVAEESEESILRKKALECLRKAEAEKSNDSN